MCFISRALQLMIHYQLIKSHVDIVWVHLLHKAGSPVLLPGRGNLGRAVINGANEAK